MRRIALLCLILVVVLPAFAQSAAKKKAAPAPAPPAAQAKKKVAPVPAAQAKKKAAPVPAAQAKQGPPAAAAKKTAAAPKAQRTRVAKKTAKPKDTQKDVPKASPALLAAYAAMPVADRRALQSDLVWTGDYNGIVSDEFGERSVAAVKAYQVRTGVAETGLLSSEQRAALAAAAKAKQEASGWRVVDDAVTGARLAVPIKHAPQMSAVDSGTRWSSSRGEVQVETFRVAAPGTTLAGVFERQKKDPANRQVEYSVMRENFFVLSGQQGLKRFYVRGQIKDNEVRGFSLMYDQAMMGIMDPVAVAMSSRFEAFPSAPAGPPPRRKVEYATGIVVDGLGHAVTDRQVTEGCQVITLAGLGNAERVGEADDVALLRVYGARDLKPVAMADGGASAANVTLVGIADPQAQSGNGATSTAAARVGSAAGGLRPLEPAPAPGFSGAAALDAQGRLVGMALLRTAVVAGPAGAAAPAQFLPVEDIKAFLAGRSVAPAASGATSAEAAKASLVRVICVRK